MIILLPILDATVIKPPTLPLISLNPFSLANLIISFSDNLSSSSLAKSFFSNMNSLAFVAISSFLPRTISLALLYKLLPKSLASSIPFVTVL